MKNKKPTPKDIRNTLIDLVVAIDLTRLEDKLEWRCPTVVTKAREVINRTNPRTNSMEKCIAHYAKFKRIFLTNR